MKNKFFRRAAVLTAALFSFTCMSATAYAQSNEPVAETEPPAAVALVGGGAAYYFKVYRPKHEAAGLDEDDYDYDEADPYGDMETEEETEDEE